jgi:hypothetical protein
MSLEDPLRAGFRSSIKLLDNQRRMLADAGADAAVVASLEAIIRHLHKIPEHQIERILGRAKGKPNQGEREKAIREASELSLDEIERRLDRENISRSELEAIAIGRFHVPRGSMRSLSNISRLRQKIETLVQNERMHATIADVANASR